jgi:cytochrome c biogenesis protein CcdA
MNRPVSIACALMIAVSSLHAERAAVQGKLALTFFGSASCGECVEIREQLLKPLATENQGTLDIRIEDIESDSGYALATRMERRLNVKSPSAQELFFPDTVLLGYTAIMKSGRHLVELYLAHPQRWQGGQPPAAQTDDAPSVSESISEKLKMNFTMIGLFAAGFVDGINPCAIATMIFLISFLGTQKRNRSDVLKIGLTFTGTVFVTYFLIGLGAFRILSLMDQYRWLSLGIRVFAVSLAVIVALMSIRDAIVYYRTRDAGKMTVQLPKGIKLLIHSVIKGNLTTNKIVVGAIITGFVVTLLEGACTAKIYLPTIVMMTHQVGFRLLGWVMLVFYNLLFVTPLLIVMVSAAYGLKWDRLAKYTQNHLALAKVLLALVLFGLAAFISMGK